MHLNQHQQAVKAVLINRKKDPNFNFIKIILPTLFHLRFFIRMCLEIKNCYYQGLVSFLNLLINLFSTLRKFLVIHFLPFNYRNFNFRLLEVAILVNFLIEGLEHFELRSSYQQTILVGCLQMDLQLAPITQKIIQYQVN